MARQLTAYLETLGYKIIEKADRPDKATWGTPTEVYDLVALFTTREGNWDDAIVAPQMDDVNIGKLEKWASDAYRHIISPSDPYYYGGCGGATHLHMMVLGQDGKPMGGKGHWFWNTGLGALTGNYSGVNVKQNADSPSGWSNAYIEHGSGYTPPNKGAWSFCPFGLSDILTDAGLYKSFHIATFAVWQARNPNGNDNPPPDDGGDEPPAAGTLRELIDAALMSSASALSDLKAIKALIG